MVLTRIQSTKPSKSVLTDTGYKSRAVIIDFKFLDRCNIFCFNSLSKFDTKNKERKIFTELQHFLYESSNCKNVEELIKQYGSSKGSKVDSTNSYVKRIVNKFINEYPGDKGLLSDGLLHIHTKSNGKGKFVIFGVSWENIFYVLEFDPNHEFNGK